ncbi:MAG: hypothetical protein H6565_13100 [Lewinellaceae bacterium]|nr:hypothetical protein [Saprospiraceae bacterium]MCB0542271.1 hypothetical protein [Saprospiraceae bacterium]MCB9307526.1 hypothetical protein [Lewinellaceae bacterium]MCB9356488.1 hypothetical protein [Lewinellaceae bacterium]
MKLNILLGILVIFLGYITCKNFQKTPQTPEPEPAAPVAEQESGYNWKASHVIRGENPDGAPTLQIGTPPRMVTVPIDSLPRATASRRAYLGSGWWHLNMAYQPSDTTVHQHYQSKWLQFREDQTFDVLIKNKIVDTGRWNWDEATNEIYLSCNDPYINNTWHVTDRGFVMIWKGNTSLNVTGIQVRVVGSGNPPPAN